MNGLLRWLRTLTTPWEWAFALAMTAAGVGSTLVTDAPHSLVRAGLAGVACLALVARVRFPVEAACWLGAWLVVQAVTTESTDEVPVLLAVIVMAYSVTAHAPLKRAWLGSLTLAVACTVIIAVDPSDSLGNIAPTVVLFVLVPGGIGWGVHRRIARIAALELEAEALARDAELAVEDERRRIARELHDVVSHAVTLIAVQAEAGQAVIGRDPAAAERSLAAIGTASREALAELDRMLGLLREADGSTDAVGLARLPALVSGARAAGLDLSVTSTGASRTLDRAADHCAYRVLQEGVTNALRHAPGSAVTLDLDYAADGLDVAVTSVGRGHSSAYGGTGRGLAGLRERLLGLGGRLDVSRPDDQSFVLRAHIPARVAGPVPVGP